MLRLHFTQFLKILHRQLGVGTGKFKCLKVNTSLGFLLSSSLFFGFRWHGKAFFSFRLFLLHRPRGFLVLYLIRDGSSLAGLMVSRHGATSLFSFGLMQLSGNLHLKSILLRDMLNVRQSISEKLHYK
jgi:hypothetical protein